MSEEAVGGDDEPTRFFAHEVTAEEIVPVPPPAPGFDQKESLETGVPTDPSEVQFKRAGEETGASKKKKRWRLPAAAEPGPEEGETPPADAKPESAASGEESRSTRRRTAPRRLRQPWYKDQRKAMLAGGGALALLAAVATGSFMLGAAVRTMVPPLEIPDLNRSPRQFRSKGLGQLAAAERALAEEARKAGAPATAVNDLVAAGEQLDKQLAGLQTLANDPAQAEAATARVDEMKRTATTANVGFASALLRDAEARAQGLSAKCSVGEPRGGHDRSLRSSYLGRGFGQFHRSGPVAWRRPRCPRQIAGVRRGPRRRPIARRPQAGALRIRHRRRRGLLRPSPHQTPLLPARASSDRRDRPRHHQQQLRQRVIIEAGATQFDRQQRAQHGEAGDPDG